MDKADVSSERGGSGTGFKKKRPRAPAPCCCGWHGPRHQLGWEGPGLSAAPSPSFLSVCLSPPQTKDALLKILEDMKEDDYLNFILFSGDVSTWKESLVQATPENIQEARKFVKSITDQGSKDRGESRRSHCCSLRLRSLRPSSLGPGPCRPWLRAEAGGGGGPQAWYWGVFSRV